MATNKTTETKGDVSAFISRIKDEEKRRDSEALMALLQTQTGFVPKMWGSSIIGFGSYHYRYESGRHGDSPLIAFSPRAAAITLYLLPAFEGRDALLQQLGKHTTGKGCIYQKKMADINASVLQTLVNNHIKHIQFTYP